MGSTTMTLILHAVSDPEFQNIHLDKKEESLFRRFKRFASNLYIFVYTYRYFIYGLTINYTEAPDSYKIVLKIIHFMSDFQITEKNGNSRKHVFITSDSSKLALAQNQ